MTFLDRIWPRAEARAQVLPGRDLSTIEAWGAGDQSYGQTVSATTVQWLACACACVDAISSTIASLPCFVYRLTGTGRQEDNAHPLADLIRNGANERLSWTDFIQWTLASCLRHGNALVEIQRDDAARLTALEPIPWDIVAPKILPTKRLRFDFFDPVSLQQRRLLDTETLFLKDRSDNGLIGVARHTRCHPVVANALAVQEFSGNSMRNGAFPSGTLEATGKIGEDGIKKLSQQFKELFAGPTKAAKALILEQGIKYNSVTATPENLELLAARRFGVEEICRIYNTPPTIVGDLTNSSFTNAETALRYFAQSTLTAWVTKLEREIERSVFSDRDRRDHEFCIDLSGLLRGAPVERWQSYEIGLRAGVLNPNEVRDAEGYAPRTAATRLRALL